MRTRLPTEAVTDETIDRILGDPAALQVHFQPVFGFDSRRIVAAEALLRARVDGVDLAANIVVEAAVRCGRMRELTSRVLDIACAVAGQCQEYGRPIAMMVNLDATELDDPALVEDIAGTISEHELAPDLLWLELTETALISASATVEANLEAIRELGIELSLDDFGTGYASLSHLRSVPLTAVKLDRQFIAGVDEPGADHEIVRSVIRLAHALGLRSIAEGVEAEAQRRTLEALGCDAWQGYLGAPAVDSEAFLKLLEADREDVAALDATSSIGAVPTLDSFVLRRIAAERWAHLGGYGRGSGWAGIVHVDEEDTPLLARTLAEGINRIEHTEHQWMFAAYHAGAVVSVPVDADTVVIFGSARAADMPNRSDRQWTAEAEELADQITDVSPAKRLADELELAEALQTLVSNAPSSLDEAMRHVVECVAGSLSCEFGVIHLASVGTIAFANSSVHDIDETELRTALEGLGNETTEQRCAQDASAEPFPLPLPPDFRVRSWLAIPTAPALGGLIVCAHTDRGPRGFTTLCQRLGARLAETAELILHAAIERDELHSTARQAVTMAQRDELTGVLNRRGWNAALSEIDDKTGVSVVIVDVNDLKIINDRFGHRAGDDLLITTARCLTAIVRSTDTVARLGGDEFGVLLPSANSQVMVRIEAQLEEIVQLERIDHPNLSLACGRASRTDSEPVAALVELADRRMYENKRETKSATNLPQEALE